VTKSTCTSLPLVSIIIVNYNGKGFIENCLNSIKRLAYPRLEIIVVDNASSDGSPEIIQQKFPFVHLLRNSKNVGFAAGSNIGMRVAKGDYFFLLNPDTEIDPLCVNKLIEIAEEDPSIGVCGAKIRLLDNKRVLQHAGGKYHIIGISIDRGLLELDKGQYDEIEEVTFVCGAAMLIKRELISKIGMLDDVFFLYHEDVDFCIRAWFNGYKVIYVPSAIVYHKSKYVGSLMTNKESPLVVFHKHKNLLIILLKNFPLMTMICWFPLAILYKLLWIVIFLYRNDIRAGIAVLRSVTWTLKNLRMIMRNRNSLKHKKIDKKKFKQLFRSSRDAWYTFRKLSQWRRVLWNIT
jgi:GT2 family glycosyltransferase